MPHFDTANNVLNDAAVELALTDADMADAYASTNPAVIQLRRLLKALGRDLLREYQWTHLQKTHLLFTFSTSDTYPLPADFARIIDSTAWNRSQQMPLGGPFYAQGWQVLKAHSASGTVWLNYRIVGNQLALHPTPATGESLSYEYVSRWWVQEDGDALPTTDAPDEASDVLWLDSRLLVAGLVLRFRAAKGFDTAAAQREFNDALAAAQGGDGAAPALSLDCRAATPYDKPISAMGPIGGPSPTPGGGGEGAILETGPLEVGGLS